MKLVGLAGAVRGTQEPEATVRKLVRPQTRRAEPGAQGALIVHLSLVALVQERLRRPARWPAYREMYPVEVLQAQLLSALQQQAQQAELDRLSSPIIFPKHLPAHRPSARAAPSPARPSMCASPPR